MARLNEARITGFLINDPVVMNRDTDSEKILIRVRTVHRVKPGFTGGNFSDVNIFYDGDELMESLKRLKKYDLVDIEGVVNIFTADVNSCCTQCKKINLMKGVPVVTVRPKEFSKLDSLLDASYSGKKYPEKVLERHYKERSNMIILSGTVVNSPELLRFNSTDICRYCLAIDREYFVKTQPDSYADYPWIYSYGQDAVEDMANLDKGDLIVLKGFMHTEVIESEKLCDHCGENYLRRSERACFVPFKVDYYDSKKSAKDIALDQMIAERIARFRGR